MTTREILTPEEQANYHYNTRIHQEEGCSEKEIETELYALLLRYYEKYLSDTRQVGAISYRNPHRIDGLLTIANIETTQRLLIEAKTQHSLSRTDIWAPLAQALQYTHLLQYLDKLLPGTILIATEYEWHAVQVDTLAPLLSRNDLPWETIPSARSPKIEEALRELTPSILSYTLDVDLDLNTALAEMNTLLQESKHRSTKHHGDCTQSLALLELDPETHIYHAPSNQWWGYKNNNGTWAPLERRSFILELREQAEAEGIPSRSLSTILAPSMELSQELCRVEEWQIPQGLINTPRGTLSITTMDLTPSVSIHGHRHCTGDLDENANDTLSQATARSLQVVAGALPGEVIIVITPDRESAEKAKGTVSTMLGSYSMLGDSRCFTSQWRWNPTTGDAPILLVDGDAEVGDTSKLSRAVGTFMGREHLSHAAAIFFVSEENYEALREAPLSSPGVMIAWMNDSTSNKRVTSYLAKGSFPHLLPFHKNENNDVMLAWFRDHFTVVSKHYVLFTDLFNSYNDFLLSRGNSKVSMRNFSEALKKHKVFTDNNLAYVQRARPPKGYTHSPLPGTQEDLPERPSYVTGIAFS